VTDKKVWFSRRALKLHLVILLVVPAFLALCIWQISRAVGGNSLSWAYVFEWPLFAGYAVYMWWRFVHEDPDSTPATDTTAGRPAPAPAPQPQNSARRDDDDEHDDAELAAYNAYLAQLAERDRAAGR
jgi:DNA-binding transcriptional regulator of glucitol operon